MSAVDWARYRACPVCHAALGRPCRGRTGFTAGRGPVEDTVDRPHGGRRMRVEAVSR